MIRLGRFSFITLILFTSSACADDKKSGVRVACIGDSITFGAGVENREQNNYPRVLGELLGNGFEVRNFGISGTTLLSKTSYPYIKQKAWTDAKAFQPHIVVIKLGTNDTKQHNWKYEAEFIDDFKALIKELSDLESKPKIFVCIPVPAYKGNFGIDDNRIRTGVRPKVEQLGKELKIPVIDLYTALSDKANLFPDQIHPNAEGAKLIAKTVHAALTEKAKE